MSRRVIGRAEETSTYSWSRFCAINCLPTASNFQLSHLRWGKEPNSDLRGGRRECYHSATVAPLFLQYDTEAYCWTNDLLSKNDYYVVRLFHDTFSSCLYYINCLI